MYIRGINPDRPDYPFTHFLRTIDDIKAEVAKYRHNFQLYIGLSTVKGKSTKTEDMRARQVIMLDFDRKDWGQFETVEEFSALIKSKVPLFTHCIVDTGNGYHFYTTTNRYTDVARIAAVNKELAEITGADVKAALTTQIARIPTSFNLKHGEHKPVSIVNNALESSPETFKPVHLQKIEGMIERVQRNEKNLEAVAPLPAKEYTTTCSYHCAEAMLAEGADEGSRNFCLGRIVAYLKTIKGFTQANAASKVKEWNRRCRPPKPEAALIDEFNRYWEGDYKLLGCKLKDEKQQQILNRYCNKHLCTTIFEERPDSETTTEEMFFDNRVLKNRIMRDLSGYHYVILSVMDFVKKPLRRKDLVFHLTGAHTKKCCLSEKTLSKALAELVERRFIIYDEVASTYELDQKTYKPTYTRYAYSATLMYINKIISSTAYMVYLCLVRNLQKGESVTYEAIADDLLKRENHIGGYIKELHRAGLLNIDVSYNARGVLYNTYRLFY